MRKIKFRAWDKKSKVLVKIFQIDFVSYEANIWINDNLEETWRGFENIELMQYTGLKDKYGKEIYEGDIIKYIQVLFNTKEEDYPIHELQVAWQEYYGKWNVYETNAGRRDIEVIGNIYENPELLNHE